VYTCTGFRALGSGLRVQYSVLSKGWGREFESLVNNSYNSLILADMYKKSGIDYNISWKILSHSRGNGNSS
jgi:hypothetical protein